MTADQIEHLARLTIDHLDMHAGDPVAASLFDNLDILPLGLWLLESRRSPVPLICRHLPPGIKEGNPIVAFAIGRHRWRRFGMPTRFELLHQIVRDLFLGLANRTSD